MQSIRILGCRVDAIDRAGAIDRLADLAQLQVGAQVITLGVEMIMQAQRDEGFRAIVNAAALNVCDTIGLLLASRLRGGPLQTRVTGVALVGDIARRSAAQRDLRIFILGGRGDTAQRAARELERRFPGAIFSGARDGYFHDDESANVAHAIAMSGANVVLVGLGSPKQENWLACYGSATGAVGVGIGGALDVYAGNVARAPASLQRLGLEWAYRLMREPQRWRRQLVLPQFVLRVAQEMLLLRKEGRPSRR